MKPWHLKENRTLCQVLPLEGMLNINLCHKERHVWKAREAAPLGYFEKGGLENLIIKLLKASMSNKLEPLDNLLFKYSIRVQKYKPKLNMPCLNR